MNIRQRIALWCILVAVHGESLAAEADRNREFLAQYPAGTVAALMAPPPDSKTITVEQLAKLPPESGRILQMAPADVLVQGIRMRRRPDAARVIVTYAGQQRPTAPEFLKAIEIWGAMTASQEGHGRLYRTELAFVEAGKTFWIPVNAFAMDREADSFKSRERHVLALNAVGWLADGRPVLVASYGALESEFKRAIAGSSGGAAQPGTPPAAPGSGGDRKFDPSLYRSIPFAQLLDAPTGAPVSNAPVMGLREDQVRAKATFLRNVRQSTKTDTRLRDAWTRARGFKPEVAKAFTQEYEFSDGDRRIWLPVFSLAAYALHDARAGDEVELYVHRFDAPRAAAELPGPEAVAMAVFVTPRAKAPAAREEAFTTFAQGKISFSLRGGRYGFELDPAAKSTYVDNSSVGGTGSLFLRFENPRWGSALISVNGLRGPGSYTPDKLEVLGNVPQGGREGIRASGGCKVTLAKLNRVEVEGRAECPPGDGRPTDISFSAVAR